MRLKNLQTSWQEVQDTIPADPNSELNPSFGNPIPDAASLLSPYLNKLKCQVTTETGISLKDKRVTRHLLETM